MGATTVVPALIRQLGFEPAQVLAEAGVPPEALLDPAGRIGWESAARLLRVAAARTRCPDFGLRVGCEWRLKDLGLLGELVRHSPTVGSALRQLVVNHHLNSEGALIFELRQGEDAFLGYAIYVPFNEGPRYLYDAFLAAAANFMRELCGEEWRPIQVHFPHSPPIDQVPYRGIFRAPLRFNSSFCALQFPAEWLGRVVKGANRESLHFARERLVIAEKAVLIDKTYRALRTLLLHGKSSGADVAQSLGLHRRTLNRRLNSEGVTFQQMLDRVRFTVAKELLEHTELNIAEIASALGYTEGVSLIPAFRRWAGTTPGLWRHSVREAGRPAR